MHDDRAIEILKNNLNFSEEDIHKLHIFRIELLKFNSKYNLISKSTEKYVWTRHILDSAQLSKYYDPSLNLKLVDFGSGAGFPGIVLSILNKNPDFHVKLYEKSPVKRDFLEVIKNKINIKFRIGENVNEGEIDADVIVARAFKKLEEIIKISRETVRKPHKIIILKGKNAQAEINNVSLGKNYSYKLEKSITDIDSKIIVIKVKKNEKNKDSSH